MAWSDPKTPKTSEQAACGSRQFGPRVIPAKAAARRIGISCPGAENNLLTLYRLHGLLCIFKLAISKLYPDYRVDIDVMRRKLLFISLIFVLAFLPVAQAVMPIDAPADGMHEMMASDCAQVDHSDCIDVDCCSSGVHASCDANAKATQVSPHVADRPRGDGFAADAAARFLSHPAERLLRPPRNA
jgi:hypothetical protein